MSRWELYDRADTPYKWARRGHGKGKKERCTTGCINKKEAELVVDQWRQEAANPVVAAAKYTTLGDLVGPYFADLRSKKKKRSESTIRYNSKKVNRLLRTLGSDLAASAINPEVAEDYWEFRQTDHCCAVHESARDGRRHHCEKCAEAVCFDTVRKELIVLRSMLKVGRAVGLYSGDPDKAVPIPERDYVPGDVWITEGEAEAVWTELRRRNPARAAHFAYYLGTGARDGEAGRAKRGDVAECSVELKGTKTKASNVPIPITSLMAPWIERALADAPGIGEEPLFLVWNNIYRGLKSACRTVGVPVVTPNDLRRSFVTWHKNAGVPAQQLADLARHVSAAMIEKVYGQHNLAGRAQALRKYIDLVKIQISETSDATGLEGDGI